MRKLYELLGRDKPTKGDFGIEVEAEGKGMKALATDFWRSEDDPSLRGRFPDSRIEHVLCQPIVMKDVLPALKELAESQAKAKLNFSFRTSVHVHVNMHELTYPQILNVIYTYLLLEEPLLNYCGEKRVGNRFCLRLQDAEGLLESLKKVFCGGEGSLFNIARDSIRYASINLEAIPKYGSIEFRGMRGTLDVGVIHAWVKMLEKIRAYALLMDDVEVIHEQFRAVGANAFINEVLGATLTKLVGADVEHELNKSYSLSLDLPYAYKAYKAKPVVEWVPKKAKEPIKWDMAANPVPQPAPAPLRPIDPAILAGALPQVVAGMAFEEWEAMRREMIQRAAPNPAARKVKRVQPVVMDDIHQAPEEVW